MNQIPRQGIQQCARTGGLVLAVWASIGMATDVSARSHRASNQPVIRVSIYNYAHAHSLDLHDAERHAAYLFARAGVRIAWTNYPEKARVGPEQPEDSVADFCVRIVPASMAATFGPTPGELGQSAIPLGVKGTTRGGIANVFYESAKDVSSESRSFFGEVLGDAIAHELGHLLLGVGHSSQGIMKATWTQRDLKVASRGRLLFSPAQVESLQTAARSLPRNSFTMAAAGR